VSASVAIGANLSRIGHHGTVIPRTLLLAVLVLGLLAPAAGARVTIRVESNPRADLISGGQALVAIKAPKGKLSVRLGKRSVRRAFKRRASGRFEGIVRGLKVGRNVLTVRRANGGGARLVVTNHPNGGPVFAGPQVQPWKCPDGARDADCNQPATFTFLYRSTDTSKAGLQPYDPKNPPGDVATTTTDGGQEVPFIVRLEQGFQDRDRYKIFALFDPEKPWTRWAPQAQWNHRVLVTHGGNCGGDYAPGNAPTDDFSGTIPTAPGYTPSYIAALGMGYAVMTSALDNTGHNCNVAREAEALMMLKERLIERYGDVQHTIGTGCSGGSIAQQTIANAYPRLVYDGLVITCAYPDTMTAGAQFADYHLLRPYFEDPAQVALGWTPVQWAAVEGRPDPANAIVADEGLFKAATNPIGDCVPPEQAYDPQKNPGGVRCSILDFMKSIFGPRPKRVWSPMERKVGHGFAGQPFGNAGIQYGLGALQDGVITADQFVDLNEKIGGGDVDLNPTPERLAGDTRAVRNAYRSGMINEGDHLSGVAIIDHAGPDPGAAHDYAHTWWIRDRMMRAQGHLDNNILWFGPEPLIGDLNWPTEALVAVDRWLNAVEKDTSAKSRAEKIKGDRPADITERCTADLCEQTAATRYGTPRQVAGGEEFNDIVKCRLKPLVRADEKVTFTDAQWERLQKAFPTGVCDWTKPGIGQRKAITWLKYADKRDRVIYGGRRMGPAPRSRPLR
jgi:hypothetical protein